MSREGSEHVTRFAFENAGAHARAQRLAWFGSCLSRAHDLQHTAVRARAMYLALICACSLKCLQGQEQCTRLYVYNACDVT